MKGYKFAQYGSFIKLSPSASEAEIEEAKALVMDKAIQTMTEVIKKNIELIVKLGLDYSIDSCICVGWKCVCAERGEVPDSLTDGFVHIIRNESWAVAEEDFKRLMPDKEDEP